MKNFRKYAGQYFLPEGETLDWVRKDALTAPPVWCSVDLRDGNQALAEPMDEDTKTEFFRLLVEIGFKEIEIAFPASSETEFSFVRRLVGEGLIPDDVTVQVLTQSREHIIRRTFEAIRGAKNVVVHLYNSVSPAQREQVFHGGREEVKAIATSGAKLMKELAEKEKGNIRFEYSPESFTSAEPEFAAEVCNAVLEIWAPTAEKKAGKAAPSPFPVPLFCLPPLFCPSGNFLPGAAGGTDSEKFHREILHEKPVRLREGGQGQVCVRRNIRHPPAQPAMGVIMPRHVVIVPHVRARHPQLQRPPRRRKSAQDAEHRRPADGGIPLVDVPVHLRRRGMIERLQGVVYDPFLPGLPFLHMRSSK